MSAIFLLAASTHCTGKSSPERRPNILVIISDDQGFADVGYHGSDIQTPNIDALAASGLVLDRFYVYPYCNPTRSAFYSGMFPRRETFNIPGFNIDDGGGIELGIYTIAERFRDAGYATALIGKWHMGSRPRMHPNANGFDYFYGLLGGVITYFGHYWLDYDAKPIEKYPDWQRNGVEINEPGYSTTLLGKDAATFISNRDPEKPFFLVLSFNAPHTPSNALAKIVTHYENTSDCASRPKRCTYMAQVDTMDAEIGRVLGTLESQEIAEETIVFFFSDNGGITRLGSSNAPYRGEKTETLEGALRVPAIVNWPSVIEPGSSDQRMRVEDVFATLEGAAKLARRAPSPGRDLWSSLLSGSNQPREAFYIVNAPDDLVELNKQCKSCLRVGKRSAALITDDWKLLTIQQINEQRNKYSRERIEYLYHLSVDPYEERDVASSEPEMLHKMREQLAREEEKQVRRDRLPPEVGAPATSS